MGLIIPREAFRRMRDELIGTPQIVFTNGCFDLLHPGHLRLLHQARALGDTLVVGLNSDDSVRRLKGPSRPVTGEMDRARALASLLVVDFVIIFGEDLPIETIRAVRPSHHVKGGDYTIADLPEAPVVEELGGQVVLLPIQAQYSTTGTLTRIAECPPGEGDR